MERTEILKANFRRNNETENKVLCDVIDMFPDVIVIRSNVIPDLTWCKKNYKGTNVLILDAKNVNLTEYGNHRTTEFCFIHKSGKVVWIDAKQTKRKGNNITDTLYGEFSRAVNCEGQYVFVCAGEGYTKQLLADYDTHLKAKYPKNEVIVTFDKLFKDTLTEL